MYKEYEGLKSKYNDLEMDLKSRYYSEKIELEWKLDSCYQQLGDLEDNPYDVNRDGEIIKEDTYYKLKDGEFVEW